MKYFKWQPINKPGKCSLLFFNFKVCDNLLFSMTKTFPPLHRQYVPLVSYCSQLLSLFLQCILAVSLNCKACSKALRRINFVNKTKVTKILLPDVCYCKVKFSQEIVKCENSSRRWNQSKGNKISVKGFDNPFIN